MISIQNYKIGPAHPCFIIAEAGVNHNGDLALAHKLVDEAFRSGADAVKFQTFHAERLVAREAPKAEYQLQHTAHTESQFEMLRHLELSPQAHKELMAHCKDIGLRFMSTPFDEVSADFLDELGLDIFKISSGEVTNLPFLAHVARKGKPVILSTGMCNLDEVATAIQTMGNAGQRDLILLHCVTNYPADPADCNLRAMQTMSDSFKLLTGWSDHTPGIEISLAAVALGACVIEKHFTLDRNLPGPDHQASLEPGELREMVRAIRAVQSSLGDGVKRPAAGELVNRPVARRSLHWNRPLAAGMVICADDLIALRPGTGIPPGKMPLVIGRKLARPVQAGEMVGQDQLEAVL
jgi:N-acetylneuraminate synthase